jgi:hypothetical protein
MELDEESRVARQKLENSGLPHLGAPFLFKFPPFLPSCPRSVFQTIVHITLYNVLEIPPCIYFPFFTTQTTSGCHSVPLLARYVSGPCKLSVQEVYPGNQMKHMYRTIRNSLVLDPPGEPLKRGRTGIESAFRLVGNRCCDQGALVCQRLE